MAAARPGESAEDRAPAFEVIAPKRAYEHVAAQIRRQIGLGIIAVGQSLPPERRLMRMFGVGRNTVQLAIAALEADQLIETRRGRNGGSFVLAPSDHSAALDVRVLEVGRSADVIIEAVDYRLIVEPSAARMAAATSTESQLADIRAAAECVSRAESDDEFMREDTAFHVAIARATGNRFLVAAVEQTRLHLNSILGLLPDDASEHLTSTREHAGILAALSGGDGDRAYRLMREHVARTHDNVHTILTSLRTQSPGSPR